METVSITFTPKALTEFSNDEITSLLSLYSHTVKSLVWKYRSNNQADQFKEIHGVSVLEALADYLTTDKTNSRDLGSFVYMSARRYASKYKADEVSHGFCSQADRIHKNLAISSLDETTEGRNEQIEKEIDDEEIAETETLITKVDIDLDGDPTADRLAKLSTAMERLRQEHPEQYEAVASKPYGKRVADGTTTRAEQKAAYNIRNKAYENIRRYMGLPTADSIRQAKNAERKRQGGELTSSQAYYRRNKERITGQKRLKYMQSKGG